jgi:hypothetical protein
MEDFENVLTTNDKNYLENWELENPKYYCES